MRSAFTYAALIALLVLIGSRLTAFLDDPTVLPPDDDVEYWAAGKLNRQGLNPYDPELLYPLQRFEAGRDIDELGETTAQRAVMMWNPPWTLTLAMPLGLLKPRACQLLLLVSNFLIVGCCTAALWILYGGGRKRWAIAVVLGFSYLPTVYCITSGQISAWILLGATLFLAFERRGLPYLAGAAAALMAIKPHLVYLFWILLFFWSFTDIRGWKMIAGGLGAGAVCTLIPLAFNPSVLGQYAEALAHRPPEQFQSPTLGTLLRKVGDWHSFGLQFAPMVLGLLWLTFYLVRHSLKEWNWRDRMPAILIASFVTASYGAWPYDLLILLPALFDIAGRVVTRQQAVTAIAAYLSIVLPMAALSALKINSFYFIWAAPLIAVEYAWLNARIPRMKADPC